MIDDPSPFVVMCMPDPALQGRFSHGHGQVRLTYREHARQMSLASWECPHCGSLAIFVDATEPPKGGGK